jgi:hypothetical protein
VGIGGFKEADTYRVMVSGRGREGNRGRYIQKGEDSEYNEIMAHGEEV